MICSGMARATCMVPSDISAAAPAAAEMASVAVSAAMSMMIDCQDTIMSCLTCILAADPHLRTT